LGNINGILGAFLEQFEKFTFFGHQRKIWHLYARCFLFNDSGFNSFPASKVKRRRVYPEKTENTHFL
jgi:hypothetical protein